ncbi:hypothetical protein B0H13DRAFT_1854514 [Mycena leptocephala]|nr:hypothetical protein B0H13DRAFT_1854514 [Mycena leptocephala]
MILDNPNAILNGLQAASPSPHEIFESKVPQPSPPPYSSHQYYQAIPFPATNRRSRQRRPQTQFWSKYIVACAAVASVLLNCLLIVLLMRTRQGPGDDSGRWYAINGMVPTRVEQAPRADLWMQNMLGLNSNSTSHSRRGGGGHGGVRTREGRGSGSAGQGRRRGNEF